jgi:hypothetical protein
MVDADLADLYGVPTGALNQAVRRNMERFPEDFAFRLSKAEFEHWKSQIVISNPSAKMGLRHAPFVGGALWGRRPTSVVGRLTAPQPLSVATPREPLE